MIHEWFQVALPNGLRGKVEVRLDLERLAQDMAWKAYHSKSKKSSLKNGAVKVTVYHDVQAKVV